MKKEDLLKIIGNNIKIARQEKGVSQMDLAARMEGKIDTTNISRIEAGRTNPTIYTLYRISEALEVRMEDLIHIDK